MSKMTVDLSPQLDEAVNELAKKSGVTKAQVVRRALALLSYLDEESETGQVLVRNDDGREKEVVFHSTV